MGIRIARIATAQNQNLLVLAFLPGVASFSFSLVVPIMTGLLGIRSAVMQEHRMCRGKIMNQHRK
jgi:hypothetical protein